MAKRIYFNGETPENREPIDGVCKTYLGGKGQSLAVMTRMGLPVPGFYTIVCQTCNEFTQNGKQWPTGLREENDAAMSRLVAKMGKTFYTNAELERIIGRGFASMSQADYDRICADAKITTPLLLSIRSGAAQSLPGMMDTILNLGLNDCTTKIFIAKNPQNARFVYDSYRRFIMMFSDVVLHVDSKEYERILTGIKARVGVTEDTQLGSAELQEAVREYLKLTRERTGRDFPQDASDQLYLAINAVFDSWNNERAIVYRNMNKIPHDLGTAVNVCAMVFGNLNNISGSGVGFTRDPKSGVKYDYLYGEFLKNAQGEDVVAGTRTPMDIKNMREDSSDKGVWKRIYAELSDVYAKLEQHYNDLVDLEFTIEDGKLYMLQARAGKRTAFAMVKVAIDMYREGRWSKEKMLTQIEPNKINEFLFPRFDPAVLKKATPCAKGLAASPGAAVGQIVFSPALAQQLKAENAMKIILTREETSPEDISGMNAAVGILTSCGGQTSHAAVVARQMGKTCVCGCTQILIDENAKTVRLPSGKVLHELDWVSIDGSTGNIYEGQIAQIDAEITPDLQELLKIADEVRTLKIRTNADTERDCKTAIYYGAEGIGLTRSEHQFFEPTKIKAIRRMILAKTTEQRVEALRALKDLQKADFKALYTVMDGRPVNVRLLDPPLHEFLPVGQDALIAELSREMGVPVAEINERIDSLHEQNPMIGFRGCRLGVVYPEISEMQFRAIFEAALEVKHETKKAPGVEIMFPFIISEKEIDYFRTLLERVRDEVFAQYKDSVTYSMGTMVELPRAALISDRLAEKCDYFSFGTNDLTQTTLGCSRDDCGKFMPAYLDKGILKNDPFVTLDFDGVGRLIKMTVDQARTVKPNFKVGICGEQTDPASIEFLQKAGLTYVSCSPYRVLVARVAAAIAAVKAKQ